MLRYMIKRFMWLIFVVAIITLLTFLIFFVMPPVDPAVAMAGKTPTPAIIAEVRQQLGLDQPLIVQYGRFVKHIFLGDEYGWPGFGISYNTRAPIVDELFRRMGVTFQLAIGGAVAWLVTGVSIGIISALKRRRLADRAAMGFALFGVSAPTFWLGLMALFVFWQQLQWLPGTGYTPFGENPAEWLSHMILPWLVLAMFYSALYARMVRANLIETMGEDYIRTARAKGLSERKVIGKHGLRASLTPIVTIFGIDLASLLGGAVITENVFNMPGMGQYVVRSVFDGDLPVILAVTVFASFFVTFANLVVDIAYAYLDPRVRLT
jgi:peptide/nickel transport system permease protein